MPEFSSSKIIHHRFHVNNNIGESGKGYDMIIFCDLMVLLGLLADLKRQFLQWYGVTVPMKEPNSLLGGSDLTSREMHEVVMQTEEPTSTREANDKLLKILYSAYEKADLKKAYNHATHMNADKRTQLLRLLDDIEDLFGGTLGDWDTDPVELEINLGSKLLNSKLYIVPRITRVNFCKELKRLVKIGVLNLVQQSQYSPPIFIIPKKEETVRFIIDYRRLNHQLVRNPYPLPRIGETMQQLARL